MKRIPSLLLLASCAALAACSSSTDEGTVPNTVSVTNNQFSPAARTVATGTTVTWVFSSAGTLHNVTFAPGQAGAPANISDASSGSFPRTFNAAGTFNYSCTNHPGMNGSVTVNP